MSTSLTDKTALVTGASRGIGRAIAWGLARAGAKVFGTATTPEGAQRITDESRKADYPVHGLCLNVTQKESVAQLFETLAKDHKHPDILINNAGITRDNLVLRMSEEEWQAVIETNLTAVYRMSKACMPTMLKQRWGRIINISSIVGMTGNSGQANYAAAKAGLIAFSKSLAQEMARRNITVNIIAPGFIDSDMTRALPDVYRDKLLAQIPMKRLGTGEDIAEMVAFLSSESANYITGETIHINGGMLMA